MGEPPLAMVGTDRADSAQHKLIKSGRAAVSLDFAIIFKATLLAFLEEGIKFLIVWVFKRTPYPVIALLPFALLEGLTQFSSVSRHFAYLGVDPGIASILLALYFLIFTKVFHVATSYVYLKAEFPAFALVYCTLWHTTSNLLPLPMLSLKYYLLLPIWGLLSSLAAVAIFLLIQRLFSRALPPVHRSAKDPR